MEENIGHFGSPPEENSDSIDRLLDNNNMRRFRRLATAELERQIILLGYQNPSLREEVDQLFRFLQETGTNLQSYFNDWLDEMQGSRESCRSPTPLQEYHNETSYNPSTISRMGDEITDNNSNIPPFIRHSTSHLQETEFNLFQSPIRILWGDKENINNFILEVPYNHSIFQTLLSKVRQMAEEQEDILSHDLRLGVRAPGAEFSIDEVNRDEQLIDELISSGDNTIRVISLFHIKPPYELKVTAKEDHARVVAAARAHMATLLPKHPDSVTVTIKNTELRPRTLLNNPSAATTTIGAKPSSGFSASAPEFIPSRNINISSTNCSPPGLSITAPVFVPNRNTNLPLTSSSSSRLSFNPRSTTNSPSHPISSPSSDVPPCLTGGPLYQTPPPSYMNWCWPGPPPMFPGPPRLPYGGPPIYTRQPPNHNNIISNNINTSTSNPSSSRPVPQVISKGTTYFPYSGNDESSK